MSRLGGGAATNGGSSVTGTGSGSSAVATATGNTAKSAGSKAEKSLVLVRSMVVAYLGLWLM